MFSPFVCVLLGATGGNAHAKLAHEPGDVEGSGLLAADRDGGGHHVHPSRLRPQLLPGRRKQRPTRATGGGLPVRGN